MPPFMVGNQLTTIILHDSAIHVGHQKMAKAPCNQLKPTQTNSSTNHIRSQTHVAVEDMDRSTSDEEDVATGANKILGESRLVYKKHIESTTKDA
jgi:hypothetical protein